VYVGEKFKQGRYVVLKKLGWGHFSTVWLVLDNTTHTFAALKVRSRNWLVCLKASMLYC
jgi:serine/threonine-protein kinase SRPK3